jgi:hydrogenase-1 operon protein HyaF
MDTLNKRFAVRAGAAPEAGAAAVLAKAVLREVARALAALASDPGLIEPIDLRSPPLDDEARALLQRRLGEGEIAADFDLAGATRIRETGYAGVWWVRHADEEGRAVLEQIVVARVPPLLLAHPDDIAADAQRLADELAA